eukprot:4475191-Prymnesium_polylepis.1
MRDERYRSLNSNVTESSRASWTPPSAAPANSNSGCSSVTVDPSESRMSERWNGTPPDASDVPWAGLPSASMMRRWRTTLWVAATTAAGARARGAVESVGRAEARSVWLGRRRGLVEK